MVSALEIPAAVPGLVWPDTGDMASEERPGAFLYDPVSGGSEPFAPSSRWKAGETRPQSIPLPSGWNPERGLTLEMFVKAEGHWECREPLLIKTRKSPRAATMSIFPKYLANFRQTYWGGAVETPDGTRHHWRLGHYVSVGRIHEKTADWRHVAIVYDPASKRVTVYADYLEETHDVGGLVWDDAPILLGGTSGPTEFNGWISAVRVTPRALNRSDFLRARESPLRGVRFDAGPSIFPDDFGHINVKTVFGAAGDGKTDDTAAFQKAFDQLANQVPLDYHTLYIPPGEYLLSDRIRWSRFLVVIGAGPDKTVLRLKDRSPGYGAPANPKPVVECTRVAGGVDSNQRTSGDAIGNYIYGLTIDTGSGNPGAVGLEYHANNHGEARDLLIRSGDGSGVRGLSLMHKDTGPCLIKNVRIDGFDFGVRIRRQEYSATLENVALRNQRIAGIHCEGNILAMRRIWSDNTVPAVVGVGGNSMLTLLDSKLIGGSPGRHAVETGGALYVRGLETSGYGGAIRVEPVRLERRDGKRVEVRENPVVRPGPSVEEFTTNIVAAFGRPEGSLKLPVEDPPELRAEPLENWVSVRAFQDRCGETRVRVNNREVTVPDWAPAIQAAIDSGARTLYVPKGDYHVGSPVRLGGNVGHLVAPKGVTLQRSLDLGDAPAVVYIQPDPGHTTHVQWLGFDGLEHRGAGTLVLQSASHVPYTNGPGAGKLFMENVIGNDYLFQHPQQVWVRQWNVERHAEPEDTFACIENHAATLWSLGFKTEYESLKLRLHPGSRTEILGAFLYPIGRIPPDRPIAEVTDASLGFVYGTSVYGSNHEVHILDTRGGTTVRVENEDLTYSGSRGRMDLYVTSPELHIMP